METCTGCGETLHGFQVRRSILRGRWRLGEGCPPARTDICSIQVDEFLHAIRIDFTDLVQFRPGQGVSHEYGLAYVPLVEDLDNIARPRGGVIAPRGLARSPETTARDADDMEPIGELV